MSTKPAAGEIWIADFDMVAKQRPVLVLAYPEPDVARALVVIAPLTSQIRGYRGEVDIDKLRWLPKPSAINIQGIASADHNCLVRKLGTLPSEQFSVVKDALRDLLGL